MESGIVVKGKTVDTKTPPGGQGGTSQGEARQAKDQICRRYLVIEDH